MPGTIDLTRAITVDFGIKSIEALHIDLVFKRCHNLFRWRPLV
jgi:hypothetical protein